MSDVTVLVQSCDKYADLWPIFFEVFNRQWHDCPYPILLNTESSKYESSYFHIQNLQLYKDLPEQTLNEVSWSERYIETLKHIKTKYVLVILDDFFIRKPVDTSKFEDFVNVVEHIPNFGAVYFNYLNTPTFYNKRLDMFLIHRTTWTRVNSVCGLWNTEVLKSTLVPGETPWTYEHNATERFKNIPINFYSANPETSPIQIDFHEQIMKGKWTAQCVSLLQSMNIDVDFSKRGITEMKVNPPRTFENMNIKEKVLFLCEKHIVLYDILCFFRRIKFLLK